MKGSLIHAVVAGMLCFAITFPAYGQTFNGQTLQGRVTYVPVGTALDTTLASPVDSAVAKPGDIFNAKLYAPLYQGSDLVLPANTMLEGQVTSADKSGHAGINGKMDLRLIAAITPDGIRYPLSATLSANQQKGVEKDKNGVLHGRSTKANIGTGAARTVAWAAGGTLVGLAFAPIIAGSLAAGAVAGLATGAAIGLGSNLWRKGIEVKIPSGTRMQFALDQPLSLSTSTAALPGGAAYK